MPLDTRAIGEAIRQWPAPPDVLGSLQGGMARAYQLQAAQQTNQANALQLAEAQRQEQERGTLARAFRGAVTTDPTTGRATLDAPKAFSAAYQTSTNPLAVLKAETEYGKGQAESRKSVLEAQKAQLQQQQEQLALVGQVANGVLAAVDAGVDPQQAYERGIAAVQQAGLPIQGLPPTFDRGVVTQFAATSQKYQEALQNQQKVIDQQLRERELAETQQRTDLQREELGVRRADVAEKRAERLETRETQATQRVGERENQLRDEFTSLTKDYRTQRDAYGRVQVSAQEPSAAGDLSMIFSYMKLLDPGSVVREGEQATAANARGVPDAIRNQYNRLMTGERLTDTQRADFVARAEKLYGQATSDYDNTRTQYQDLAKRSGADPANVTLEFGSTAAPRGGQGGGAGAGGGAAGGKGSPVTADEIGRLTQRSGLSAAEVIQKLQSQGYRIEGLD